MESKDLVEEMGGDPLPRGHPGTLMMKVRVVAEVYAAIFEETRAQLDLRQSDCRYH